MSSIIHLENDYFERVENPSPLTEAAEENAHHPFPLEAGWGSAPPLCWRSQTWWWSASCPRRQSRQCRRCRGPGHGPPWRGSAHGQRQGLKGHRGSGSRQVMGEEPYSWVRGQRCSVRMMGSQQASTHANKTSGGHPRGCSPSWTTSRSSFKEHHHPILYINTMFPINQVSFFLLYSPISPLIQSLKGERVKGGPSWISGQASMFAAPQAMPTSNDLHELWASHCQEGHLGLRCHRLGQQCLSTARRSEQKCTLRNFGTKLKETFWALEKQQMMWH